MQLEHIRREIERMRLQVHRQRGDIRKLQQAGISTASAEALLEQGTPMKGNALGGRSW
jgi:hypothetical protein